MDVSGQAAGLVSALVKDIDPLYGLGSMTGAIYDTAWLSMVSKSTESPKAWLFPSCFQHLLDTQGPTGGWDSGHDQDTDSILNAAAALLAFYRHRGDDTVGDLEQRIANATGFLRTRLSSFELKAPLPVGFELLLPALIEYLGSEGAFFDFPARHALLKIRDKKLERIDIETLYAGKSSTLLHSLEAFIGKVDFDRLGNHKISGSMMASPSSTAAYLMHASKWDEESENYLRHVVASSTADIPGAVPSAFPSTFFEISWVLSTLLQSGYTKGELGEKPLNLIKAELHNTLSCSSGLVGFAPLLEPDADDTAKAIITLNLLGSPTSAANLVRTFSNGEHFCTYKNERDPSITTNSNVLKAMCMSSEAASHATSIEMVTKFLCREWWRDPSNLRDKWNLSPHYATMLMIQALTSFLIFSTRHDEATIFHQTLRKDVVVTVFQALERLVECQEPDGSWGGMWESTAYAMISIQSAMSIAISGPFLSQVETVLERGREFLGRNQGSPPAPERLWIEKVAYGSRNLSQAYILAALNPPITNSEIRITDFVSGSLDEILKPIKFYQRLPIFSSTPASSLAASLVQGALLKDRLLQTCRRVFSKETTCKEKYLSFIPFTWFAGNSLHGRPLSLDVLFEMMVISALAYQVDELVEGKVASLPLESFQRLESSIDCLGAEIQGEQEPHVTNGNGNFPLDYTPTNGNGEVQDTKPIQDAFKSFIRYLWEAPYVQRAKAYDRTQLMITIIAFLKAHLAQTRESRRLGQQQQQQATENSPHKILTAAPASLLTWTHTTSGDHTAGPFAMAAFLCMLSDSGSDTDVLRSSPHARYVMQDVARRLAAVCRLYNDYGSAARDRAEDNLNSLNFPEFAAAGAFDDDSEEAEAERKRELLRIAEYERRGLEFALEELRPLVDASVYQALMVFYASADMYGQMYVLKDFTARVKPSAS